MNASDQLPKGFVPKPGRACVYCDKPVDEPGAYEIFLAHGNGGAYGSAPAHKACDEAPCRRCGEPDSKDRYGRCKSCEAESWENS